MKLKTSILPLFTAFLSVVGIIIRYWMHTAGTDAEGLIIKGHPSTTVMAVLLVGLGLMLAVFAFFPDRTTVRPGKSAPGAVGCYIGAVGLLITAVTELSAMSALDNERTASAMAGLLSVLFGFASVGVMVVMGNCRSQGKPLNRWAYTVIIAFFVFHLLQQYQVWTREPQLSSYLFPLFASITLMLCTYYRASKDLVLTGQRQYLVLSQAALFFSMMSIGGKGWVFYCTMAAWMLLDSLPGKDVK